jgi:tRNA pseudouridine55 synthase
MTYAGRLDPMAEGVLIVLTGEKNKEREAYTGLDKDYEFEFILGLETDTHDVLGKITETKQPKVISEKDIQNALKKFTGKFKQKYPAYSSKVVGGVPLFDLARKGKLATVVMPDHEVEVKKSSLSRQNKSQKLISKSRSKKI